MRSIVTFVYFFSVLTSIKFIKFQYQTGENLAVDDLVYERDEDTGYGTTIKVYCPPGCSLPGHAEIWGGSILSGLGFGVYTDTSSVCVAAAHAGIGSRGQSGGLATNGGFITITLRHYSDADDSDARVGTTSNGITSGDIKFEYGRLFSVEEYNPTGILVQTIAGRPAATLEESCGFLDAGIPLDSMYVNRCILFGRNQKLSLMLSRFRRPTGIDIYETRSPSESDFVYIADTENHAIRLLRYR